MSRFPNPRRICANTAKPALLNLSDIRFKEHLIDIKNNRKFGPACSASCDMGLFADTDLQKMVRFFNNSMSFGIQILRNIFQIHAAVD